MQVITINKQLHCASLFPSLQSGPQKTTTRHELVNRYSKMSPENNRIAKLGWTACDGGDQHCKKNDTQYPLELKEGYNSEKGEKHHCRRNDLNIAPSLSTVDLHTLNEKAAALLSSCNLNTKCSLDRIDGQFIYHQGQWVRSDIFHLALTSIWFPQSRHHFFIYPQNLMMPLQQTINQDIRLYPQNKSIWVVNKCQDASI